VSISYEGHGTFASSSLSPISPSLPSGLAEGDLMVLQVIGRADEGGGDTMNVGDDDLTGWTL
jgi:hypothetical protein